ncbi:SDR family oxidoreductase [Paraburkholderia unamae]|uniref:3-oxoacyl-[acyl-carrier protein] reductase n=1 Tax=Paraburkholderia unamae TaxID=219649 RepID=A0ABX5KYJ5_9BURK|nr:SDR family oxidoreductase [Paraburkholderia unamae]PVX85907.1 3-oxoacyl-[acyl-carrier protein] reductase [Paraburkholderia unamae]
MQSTILSGKRVLVSGGSMTLRKSVAQGLIDEGAQVTNDTRACRDTPSPRAADLFGFATQQMGAVDIFVYLLTSIEEPERITDLTLEQYDFIVRERVKTPFFLLQQAAKHVSEHGRIVLVLTANHNAGVANAGADAAVRTFARVLTREIGARGITVNVVSGGRTESCDVVSLVLLLTGEEGRWINGQTLVAAETAVA